MAVTKEEIKTAYPLPVYNYRVDIGETSVAFSEVSGLSISYETTVYKESPTADEKVGPEVMIMPAQSQPPTVSLKKGVVKGVSVAALYQWIMTTKINQVEKKDIAVHLLNEAGEAVITWKVVDAFPIKLDAPSFTAESNDVAIESMELMATSIQIAEA
ncbi:MAG: phage tail protein [Acidobacteriota bacterium]